MSVLPSPFAYGWRGHSVAAAVPMIVLETSKADPHTGLQAGEPCSRYTHYQKQQRLGSRHPRPSLWLLATLTSAQDCPHPHASCFPLYANGGEITAAGFLLLHPSAITRATRGHPLRHLYTMLPGTPWSPTPTSTPMPVLLVAPRVPTRGPPKSGGAALAGLGPELPLDAPPHSQGSQLAPSAGTATPGATQGTTTCYYLRHFCFSKWLLWLQVDGVRGGGRGASPYLHPNLVVQNPGSSSTQPSWKWGQRTPDLARKTGWPCGGDGSCVGFRMLHPCTMLSLLKVPSFLKRKTKEGKKEGKSPYFQISSKW